MIENHVQRSVTEEYLLKFRMTRLRLEQEIDKLNADVLFAQISKAAVESMIAEFEADLEEYKNRTTAQSINSVQSDVIDKSKEDADDAEAISSNV